MVMEMKLSQQDRNLLKNLTRSLDNLAISLGKNQSQAPKSPKRLSEPVCCLPLEPERDQHFLGNPDCYLDCCSEV